MRIFLAFLITIFSSAAFGQNTDYEVIINGQRVPINVDEQVTVKNAKGEQVTVILKQKDTLVFRGTLVEFKYPRQFSINRTEIDEDIQQLAVITASGNGYLVQEFLTINPSKMTELMLDELTKESVSYGYDRQDEDVTINMGGGMKLEGKKAVLTYQGEKSSYTVLTHGKKDSGIIVALLTNDEETGVDKNLIDLFLQSIRYK